MSFNRDNITFQNQNGKWSIGFWNFYETNSYNNPDYDSEWDVEYTYDGFWFVSQGHDTPQKAYESYCKNHANPSGTQIIEYKNNEKECDLYEQYAQSLRKLNF